MARITRLAVFASGQGSNFVALAQAIQAQQLPATIVRLIVDKKNAGAIEKAKQLGIPYTLVDYRHFADRQAAELAILDQLNQDQVDGILLAGYMRLLTETLLTPYAGRIINIHPALLPSFPGTHGIQDAFDYGVRVTGVTVHYVDAGMDTGKIIAQQPVVIAVDDQLIDVEARIHAVEHQLYTATLAMLLERGEFIK
ncbi:phosphoribosylglycinamide formyltransferase [Weissella diestrammenae]|uniref:Phosphoribosylglycinamide formyltransferase n=1 Tax=Weissella diestrammenae TaxID=1162633 RepID=A0A7G9T455_9LACO|nr:phosphoribosylglycinamide formyltransferase [Weissella diestrammenae]MCM0583403.1 phosphoribosylglycinamide formyltransferase [Weissella diestrammenae]QNN74880.1 phosphoribosylglycinamide formyltransferase [Weissella diestrammenae]